jgi:hypothetical protein
MSFIQAAAQSRPEAIAIPTVSVLQIAQEHKAVDISFIPNPKNCGYDYLWFDNNQPTNNLIKVKIGTKAAAVVAGLSPADKIKKLVQSKMPIYVNMTRLDGTPLPHPSFTFGPEAELGKTVKVTLAEVFGTQELEGQKK